MKIVVAGETYAENLGDGVIAKTLGFLVERSCPGCELSYLDISGRSDWQSHGAAAYRPQQKRSSLKSLLIPAKLRRLIRWHILGERVQRRAYFRARLQDADVLLIGGGQLLMDAQLQFPLFLELLTAEARALKIPIYIACCGVGKSWSWLGRWLTARVLRNVEKVAVRDLNSAKLLSSVFNLQAVSVLVDPALWTREAYANLKLLEKQKGVLGLGIIGAGSVDLHLRNSNGAVSKSDLVERWIEFINLARMHYPEVQLFTNGHPEDFELAQLVAIETERRLGYHCKVAPRPKLPEELIQLISSYSAVVAYRLHACIIATSFALPVVGMEWDSKVRSFFGDLGREALCLSFAGTTGSSILEALAKAEVLAGDEALVERKKRELMEWLRVVLQSATLT